MFSLSDRVTALTRFLQFDVLLRYCAQRWVFSPFFSSVFWCWTNWVYIPGKYCYYQFPSCPDFHPGEASRRTSGPSENQTQCLAYLSLAPSKRSKVKRICRYAVQGQGQCDAVRFCSSLIPEFKGQFTHCWFISVTAVEV